MPDWHKPIRLIVYRLCLSTCYHRCIGAPICACSSPSEERAGISATSMDGLSIVISRKGSWAGILLAISYRVGAGRSEGKVWEGALSCDC